METDTLIPVTVLCGFLGAGKTTLLQKLLKTSEASRWAVIVNDVGSINIDATLITGLGSASKTGGNAVEKIIQLEGGCICCSARDSLAEAVAELAASGRYKHILVETTGVAEPKSIADLFHERNEFGRSLGDLARLHALVTVIDSAHFWREWKQQQESSDKRQKLRPMDQRPVFELMLEQVECADVLILNKADLISATDLSELDGALSELNSRAERYTVVQSELPAETLPGRSRYLREETLKSPRWTKILNDIADRAKGEEAPLALKPLSVGKGFVFRPEAHREDHAAKYGLGSLVYQARRPFVLDKFNAWLDRGFPGLVRAKGFFWLKEQNQAMGFLSMAGTATRRDLVHYWWAAAVEEKRARPEDVPAVIRVLWQEPYGDRRQELVFIGVNLDEDRIREELDACLE